MGRAMAPAAARRRPVGGRRPLPGFEAHQGPPAWQQKCVNPCTRFFCGNFGAGRSPHSAARGSRCLRRSHRRAPRAVLRALPLGTLHPPHRTRFARRCGRAGLSRPTGTWARRTPARAATRSVAICRVPTARRGVGSVRAGFVNRHTATTAYRICNRA